MKKISIIIPTLGRKTELDCLLESIVAQNYSNIEVIVVDQNHDDSLDYIIGKYKNKLKIFHEKVNFKGAAKARNYGFQKASGEIINFPDDDAVMAPDILHFVDNFFEHDNDYKAIFGMVQDKDNSKSIQHFKKKNTRVKLCNLYQTTIETSMFIKKETFQEIGMYDEKFGIGTYFGAEEGADLVSRLLYRKTKMMYVAKPFFYHPNKRDYTLLDRAYNFGLGFGALVYKHIKVYKRIYPMVFYWILKALKNVLEMLVAIITLNKQMLKYNYIGLKGKIKGIVEKRKEYK